MPPTASDGDTGAGPRAGTVAALHRTAEHPRRWRALLQFSAARSGEAVRITLPDGRTIDAVHIG